MRIINIAGYKFIPLTELDLLRAQLKQQASELDLRGTILLSAEGINMSLAGEVGLMQQWLSFIQQHPLFADMSFHQTFSEQIPFRYLKVKIKKEIITLRQPSVDATQSRAPSISAAELKSWLDEQRDFTFLDTRNDYEIAYGTFAEAAHLNLKDFNELPSKLAGLEKQKPLVMFCTGGIRCEKAALYLQQEGFENVYQLDKGILGYFAEVGGAHYEGGCFVFDDRVALGADLKPCADFL